MPGSDVAAVRRAIDAEVRGRTLCDVYARNARDHGPRPALHWDDAGVRRLLTWAECREAVADVGAGLVELGVGRGDVVVVALGNRPEHHVADGGALHAGAASLSLDPALSAETAAQAAAGAGARVAVLEHSDDLERSAALRAAGIEQLIVVDGAGAEVVDGAGAAPEGGVRTWEALRLRGRAARLAHPQRLESRAAQVEPDDPATIVCTAAHPRAGVVLTHRNVLWTLVSIERFLPLPAHPRGLGHLPLAQISERVFGHYLPLHTAGSVHCCPDPQRRLETLRAIHPHMLVGAPHVWQELAAETEAVAAAGANGRRPGFARTALAAARKAARFADHGVAPPLTLRLQRAAFDRLVYTPVLERLGLDACVVAVSGAPPAPAVGLLADLGLPLWEVYGRAETTGVASATRPGGVRRGTAGRPFPGVELRLSPRGEILVRGGNVMAGYHGDEAATDEVVDDHGWLHTGDRGRLDPDGSLTLADPTGPPWDYSR